MQPEGAGVVRLDELVLGRRQSPSVKNGPTVCDGVRRGSSTVSIGVAPLPPRPSTMSQW